ncbi:hypothetical protein ISG27_12600 [Burkholderia pseudomallei]|nr:hypothetical protein [Burkholderia pseudomallei]MBF3975009.1 hypothetical protein [Burkholderia pseudomallei]
METLREGWTEYERGVIPDGISQTSREVIRHAFYHGAIALLSIGNTYRERHATEADSLAMMESIIDEIVEFNARCEVKMLLHMLAGVTR